jgi:hypothetical protein
MACCAAGHSPVYLPFRDFYICAVRPALAGVYYRTSARVARVTWGNASTFRSSLFARLISYQPAVLFSQNEPATSNQP